MKYFVFIMQGTFLTVGWSDNINRTFHNIM